MADDRVRVEIGFAGGQIMSVLMTPDAATELEEALGRSGDDGAITVDADDGRYTLALRRIVYVKRFTRESRVGFGA